MSKIVFVFFKTPFKTYTNQTELIIFSKKNQARISNTKFSLILDNIIIEKTKVKYLGVVFDQLLTFPGEVKSVLRKMACGSKTLQSIKKTAINQ